MEELVLGSRRLTLSDIGQVVFDSRPVVIAESALRRVQRACDFIRDRVESDATIYGVTTGFGANSETVIDRKHALRLQYDLIRSHACGVGDPLPVPVVRAMLLLRSASLLTEHSGAQPATLRALVGFLNHHVHPVIPSEGSVGASGDLCPLAHMCLPLLGEGEVTHDGKRLPGAEGLRILGRDPLPLSYKEGIALLNGTQLQTALGIVAVDRAQRLLDAADAACALSASALCARESWFDPRIHELRRHRGQITSAANIRAWLDESELVGADPDSIPGKKDRVQDPYSLRCSPQVHGACRGVIEHVEEVLENEANAVTDNPILFPTTGEALSGGNFHGEPIAMALDYLKLAIAEVANISDRRSFKLLAPNDNEGLPAFLVLEPGHQSGLMIAQYVGASLVSGNKVLAHPSSVDSIPTSANKEDHVAMGAQAGVQALQMLDKSERVVAIELLTSAQAFDLRRRQVDLTPGSRIESLHALVREYSAFIETDRTISPDIDEVVRGVIATRRVKEILAREL